MSITVTFVTSVSYPTITVSYVCALPTWSNNMFLESVENVSMTVSECENVLYEGNSPKRKIHGLDTRVLHDEWHNFLKGRKNMQTFLYYHNTHGQTMSTNHTGHDFPVPILCLTSFPCTVRQIFSSVDSGLDIIVTLCSLEVNLSLCSWMTSNTTRIVYIDLKVYSH